MKYGAQDHDGNAMRKLCPRTRGSFFFSIQSASWLNKWLHWLRQWLSLLPEWNIRRRLMKSSPIYDLHISTVPKGCRFEDKHACHPDPWEHCFLFLSPRSVAGEKLCNEIVTDWTRRRSWKSSCQSRVLPSPHLFRPAVFLLFFFHNAAQAGASLQKMSTVCQRKDKMCIQEDIPVNDFLLRCKWQKWFLKKVCAGKVWLNYSRMKNMRRPVWSKSIMCGIC